MAHFHALQLNWRTATTKPAGYGFALTEAAAMREVDKLNRSNRRGGPSDRDYLLSEPCECEAEPPPADWEK